MTGKPVGRGELEGDAPDGYRIKGRSTLYDTRTGDPLVEWVKTDAKQPTPEEWAERFKQAVELACIEAPRSRRPRSTAEDLRVVYPMGDPHIGMYAWRGETGEDFDLDIAVRDLRAAMRLLVDRAPASRVGHVLNMGDYFHADNASNRTARSGHALDVDSRYLKVQVAGLACMVSLVDAALTKHEFVEVTNCTGNHDDHTSMHLSIALSQRYHDEPRVKVHAPSAYNYYEHGGCLYGATHGDTCKHSELAEVMAHDAAEQWGRTRYRHWYVGHVHHDSVKERRGVTVETIRTLAARDAWHHSAGYRSGRDMKCDVWHAVHGRIARNIVGIEQVRASL